MGSIPDIFYLPDGQFGHSKVPMEPHKTIRVLYLNVSISLLAAWSVTLNFA